MKTKKYLLPISFILAIAVSFWLGHSLGAFGAWRIDSALTANQLYIVHSMIESDKPRAEVAKSTLSLAKSFESAKDIPGANADLLNPLNIRYSITRQTEKTLLRRNAEYVATLNSNE